MRLQHLSTVGFRNLRPAQLSLDADLVVLHGPNAQGKTNTLEAIWSLATLKSMRAARLREVVAWESSECTVAGRVESPHGPVTLKLAIEASKRSVSMDDEPVRDLGTWFDVIRAICCTPQHSRIVTDEPARRRAWLDRAAFTMKPSHLNVVRSYRRILAQKSAVLRSERPDRSVLEVLNEQQAQAGADLVVRRRLALDVLAPHARTVHAQLTDGSSALELKLRTVSPVTQAPDIATALYDALQASRDAELRRRRCLVGPQTDELLMTIDGRPARAYGSQGQVRSVVLALKLAELMAARDLGLRPLFLLDDLSGELDAFRTTRLIATLAETASQVWVTTTDPSLVGPARKDTANAVVEVGVSEGNWTVQRGSARVD